MKAALICYMELNGSLYCRKALVIPKEVDNTQVIIFPFGGKPRRTKIKQQRLDLMRRESLLDKK